MGGVGLATWPFQKFLWFLARVGIERHQPILAFVFLGPVFSTTLVGWANGEAHALRAFSNGLNIADWPIFRTKFRQDGTGYNQRKDEYGNPTELVHRGTGFR